MLLICATKDSAHVSVTPPAAATPAPDSVVTRRRGSLHGTDTASVHIIESVSVVSVTRVCVCVCVSVCVCRVSVYQCQCVCVCVCVSVCVCVCKCRVCVCV